jgi:hypothetical protein
MRGGGAGLQLGVLDAGGGSKIIMAKRVTFGDVVPYCTPTSLEALHGPTTGWVRVPSEINTSPDPVYNIDNRAWAVSLYSDTARVGTASQQEELLDRQMLIDLWPVMRLPQRCRAVWETKFPVLAQTRQTVS